MRAIDVVRTSDGVRGVIELLDHRVYRYDEAGTVRKFYQLFLLKLDLQTGPEFLVVCNFGSGLEGSAVNPRGSFTFLKRGNADPVRAELERKATEKERKGYYLSNAPQASKVPGKVLDVLGLTDARPLGNAPRPINVTLGEPQPAFAPRPAEQPTRGSDAVATLTDVVTQMSNRLTELVAAGDVVAAITERANLQQLVGQADHVVVDAKGRLEMLNALLAAEVSS